MSKIAIVSTELAEVAPIGGIAEYVLGLASSLQLAGHDVRIILPRYAFVLSNSKLAPISNDPITVWRGFGYEEGRHAHEHQSLVDTMTVPNLTDPNRSLNVVLLGNHVHFQSAVAPKFVYFGGGLGPEPWESFCRTTVDYLQSIESDWSPAVIACQDAHTALIPVFVNQLRLQEVRFASRCRTILTVHNLAFQMQGKSDRVWQVGLPDYLYGSLFAHLDGSNAYKAGLYSADALSTVSYTYLDEICSRNEVGFGLEGVLNELRCRGKLRGIVNGINENRMALSGLDYYHVTEENRSSQRAKILAAKKGAKSDLLKNVGWPKSDAKTPIISIRSRWDGQKGFFWEEKGNRWSPVIDGLDRILDIAKVVIVTWGTPDNNVPAALDATQREHCSRHYWGILQATAQRRPDRLKINPQDLEGTDNLGKHYLASDFFAVPSRYEPCGLMQMESQRYGCIPIVRRTGGLADTVAEGQTTAYPSPNGFGYENFHWGDLAYAVERAVETYHKFQSGDDDHLGWMLDNVLLQRNGWDERLPHYEALYGVSARG